MRQNPEQERRKQREKQTNMRENPEQKKRKQREREREREM